jgi:hypothetical protein
VTRYLLSIDPGTTRAHQNGLALFEDGVLWAHWHEDWSRLSPELWGLAAFQWLRHTFCTLHKVSLGSKLPDYTVLLEDQWLYPKIPKSKFRTVKPLIRCRASWEAAASILGATVAEAAKPNVWIPAKTKGVVVPDKPNADSEDRVLRVCELRYPDKKFTKDEAAAVLMGEWWLREFAYAEYGKGRKRRGER